LDRPEIRRVPVPSGLTTDERQRRRRRRRRRREKDGAE
jgi:hypothetical protein